MSSITDFRRALEIFSEYLDPGSYCFSAEHDVIHVHDTKKPISDTHCKELLKLGFYQEDFVEDEDNPDKKYDPNLDWTCFV